MIVTAGEAEEDGYDDEYALEDLEIAASDYIKPTLLGNFRAAWEGLPQEAEVRGRCPALRQRPARVQSLPCDIAPSHASAAAMTTLDREVTQGYGSLLEASASSCKCYDQAERTSVGRCLIVLMPLMWCAS